MLITHALLASPSTLPLRLIPCSSWSGDTSSDGWAIAARKDGTLEVRNTQGQTTLCLDVRVNSSVPMASACDDSPFQRWRNRTSSDALKPPPLAPVTRLQSVADPDGRCLMHAATSYSVGPGLLLADCEQARDGYGPPLAKATMWSVEGSALRSQYSACCGDIFVTRPVCLAVDIFPTCADLPAAAWCDASLDGAARAKALVGQLTLREKAASMDSDNFGAARLGVPPNIFSEALHGFVGGCGRKVSSES